MGYKEYTVREYTVRVYPNNTEWYLNGKLHRDECANGNRYWYQHGKFHRDDGPAVEFSDGSKIWYINGIYIFNNINIKTYVFLNNVLLNVFEKVFNDTDKDLYIFIKNALKLPEVFNII